MNTYYIPEKPHKESLWNAGCRKEETYHLSLDVYRDSEGQICLYENRTDSILIGKDIERLIEKLENDRRI